MFKACGFVLVGDKNNNNSNSNPIYVAPYAEIQRRW